MAMLNLETLERLIKAGEIDTVVTAFPDLFGRLVGKRITGHYFWSEVLKGGMHACDYLFACDVDMDPVQGYEFTSWQTGYGDIHAVPDLATLRRLPWLEKTAFVLCDVYRGEHESVEVAPRTILKRQIERARAKGLLAMGGSELEFYAFKDSFESARDKNFHDLQPYGWYIEDYHLLQGSKEEWFVRAIRNGMDGAGVPVEFSKGEWGPGQHEINLHYAEFGEMADRHVLYKHGVKEIAALNHMAITFMAKWSEKHAGSSYHLHSSLWDLDGKKSQFDDPKGPQGMSRIFRHWLAGQMAHAAELSLFYAPFVNSYKRYQAGSFAPTRVAWSLDNRTVGFRVVGHGPSLRVENRIPGADANPYLAYAATLASGPDGIDKALEPPEMFRGDAYHTTSLPTVPSSLGEAIEALEGSTFARQAFGDQVIEHYLHAARTELKKFYSVVTCWERERHLERT